MGRADSRKVKGPPKIFGGPFLLFLLFGRVRNDWLEYVKT